MFEVGEQYQGKTTGRVVEVVHVGTYKSFVRTVKAADCMVNHPAGSEHTIDNDLCGDTWKPYTPPVVHASEEIFVKWNAVSDFHISDEPSCFYDTPGTILCGKVRFTHTEGVGLTVEVLE